MKNTSADLVWGLHSHFATRPDRESLFQTRCITKCSPGCYYSATRSKVLPRCFGWGGANRAGTVLEIAKTAGGYASTPAVLVSFCALPNCAGGANPQAGLIADANGNLFGRHTRAGRMIRRGVRDRRDRAQPLRQRPTALVSFCMLPNCAVACIRRLA
jgi:hypothetical protein